MRSYHNNYPELSVINSSFAGRLLDASSTSVVKTEINGGFLSLQPAKTHKHITRLDIGVVNVVAAMATVTQTEQNGGMMRGGEGGLQGNGEEQAGRKFIS